jgi:cadmium resistance transport/sequestration family protein
MIKTLFTAIITYLATSIDEIPILFMLYTRSSNRRKGNIITIAYFAGTFFLITMGLLGAFGLGLISSNWVLGFIGLIPFIMGIKTLLGGEEKEDTVMNKNQKHLGLWFQIFIITLGLGVDDIGIYIPLFITLTGWEITLMLFVFVAGTALLCFISYQLTRIEKLTAFIETYERYIVGIIFAGIGMYVMSECGTFKKITEIF